MPEQAAIETIVEQIRQLSPAQRRILMRRLAVSGLLPGEELVSDRRRLSVAPALGIAAVQPTPPSPTARTPAISPAPARTLLRVISPPASDDQPAIRGHVVLGAPTSQVIEPAPHQMAPLPGQAPEEAIVITLRGLTLPDGEAASAEYSIHWPGFAARAVQVRFAGQPTPMQALYDTLEKALRAVISRLQDNQADPATARLAIYCPSDQLLDELIGETPVADARLQTRHDRISALLDSVGEWRLLRSGEA
jgi:hypothetical protein